MIGALRDHTCPETPGEIALLAKVCKDLKGQRTEGETPQKSSPRFQGLSESDVVRGFQNQVKLLVKKGERSAEVFSECPSSARYLLPRVEYNLKT